MSQFFWQNKKWPSFYWSSERLENLLSSSRLLQGRLIGQTLALGFTSSDEALQKLFVEEALHTSAIEGEKLDAEKVRSSVARRLGLPTAGLPASTPPTDGLIDVLYDATAHFERPLSADRLKGWQAALFPTGYSGLYKITAGEWRNTPLEVVSGPIGKEKAHFKAPPPDRLNDEMDRFLNWFNNDSKKVDGLLRAGIAHLYFVTIHPFEDGNGRIARAITDMALAQDEQNNSRYYSLSSQIMSERDAYYNILEQTQKGNGDITEWLIWFLTCFKRAMEYSEDLIANVLQKARFWKMHENTPLLPRQQKVINRLLDAGKGGFEGGLTNRKYAGIAHVSRATAFRDIEQLLSLNILTPRPGGGRSTSYDLKWAE
jgi:Fic family protein